jgi:thiol-disulfide isomerase/thioredoxin
LDGDDFAMPEEILSANLDSRLRVSNPRGEAPAQQYVQQQQQQVEQQTPANTTMGTQQIPASANGNPDEALFSKSDEKKTDKDNEEDGDDDNDSDFNDEFDDDDQALEAFRQRRLAEMKRAHVKEDQSKAKGHGEVRTISQDEFLPECTGSSKYVVVHFFHDDFERCKIMDHHLNIMAPLHLSCKFVRINAEKTPFFVAKLAIKTLPTLLVFKDGNTIERLLGFEGLSDSKNPDNFSTSRLGRWLEQIGALEYYDGPDSDEEDEGQPSQTKTGMLSSRFRAYDEDV